MKKFIRDVLLYGFILGAILGLLTYVTLAYAGTMVQYDLASQASNDHTWPLRSSESINMGDVRGLSYSQGQALDYCGITPSSACSVLAFVNDVAPNILAVESGGVEYQVYQEDDETPAHILQPVDYNNHQVSLNAHFIQDAPLAY